MAYLGYVLSMPPCKMAQKSHGCPECQYRCCMGLAERNVRLNLSGTIPEQRLAELSQDLAETCPLASCYQSWLFMHMNELPVGRTRGIKTNETGTTRGRAGMAAAVLRICKLVSNCYSYKVNKDGRGSVFPCKTLAISNGFS